MTEIRRRKPTEAEKVRLKKGLPEESRPDVVAANRGKIQKMRSEQSMAQRVMQLLRQSREEQGVTLTQLQALSGIDPGNLSRLLNAEDPNVTLATVDRLANALHRRIVVTLDDEPVTGRVGRN